MTKQESEQFMEQNGRMTSKNVHFENDIWKLASLYPTRTLNSDDYMIVAILEQGKTRTTEIRYSSLDEFNLMLI